MKNVYATRKIDNISLATGLCFHVHVQWWPGRTHEFYRGQIRESEFYCYCHHQPWDDHIGEFLFYCEPHHETSLSFIAISITSVVFKRIKLTCFFQWMFVGLSMKESLTPEVDRVGVSGMSQKCYLGAYNFLKRCWGVMWLWARGAWNAEPRWELNYYAKGCHPPFA